MNMYRGVNNSKQEFPSQARRLRGGNYAVLTLLCVATVAPLGFTVVHAPKQRIMINNLGEAKGEDSILLFLA